VSDDLEQNGDRKAIHKMRGLKDGIQSEGNEVKESSCEKSHCSRPSLARPGIWRCSACPSVDIVAFSSTCELGEVRTEATPRREAKRLIKESFFGKHGGYNDV